MPIARKRSSGGRKLALLLVSTLLGAVLAELGAGFWLVRLAPDEIARRYATLAQIEERAARQGFSYSLYKEHPYLGFIPAPNYVRGMNRHNSLGFRGEEIAVPKPTGEFRIVCLGGSTTYNPFIEAPSQAFPAQLEAALHARGFTQVRVVNGGVPGYRSWESLLNLQFRVLDLEPDMVFVYHATNDTFARLVWPPEAYRGDNTGVLSGSSRAERERSFFHASNVLRMLSIRFGEGRSPARLGTTFGEWAETARGPIFSSQVTAGRYPSGLFKRQSVRKLLATNPPRYFQRNLEHLVLVAEHHGVVPVLSSFTACECKQDASSRPEILAAIREMNEVTRGVAETSGTPFLDLDIEFPRNPALFEDSIHVNAAGASRRGEIVAQMLTERDLVPEP